MNKRLNPLTEEDFKKHIHPYLLQLKDGRGRPASISDYDFFCAVLFVMCTGISWRDLPNHYGSWHTIYTRFKRWSTSGWFWKLLQMLQAKKLISVNFTWIDSTTIAVHRHGSGALKKKGHQFIGRGRKGLSTKVHLALSTAGIQSVCLSEGQHVDMKVFPKLWELGEWSEIQYIIADKGYDYASVRIPIRKAGKIPVIPRRANAICPGLQDIYKPYYRKTILSYTFSHRTLF